ncbi:hypothetical protein F8C76_03920 [Flagellimonas olearia]|uniref:Uncharacterized protein n=1 Tax=Flagellimonas olearia TaxID=552546 RepID=A0A444VKE0_9FLAO|nr:hypothetical protein [Allomuricauda olearia]KAB7530656.1 hypothetical protein F8C76_03920 [Allomuricauda olearia]RYC51248.1 hypothetical protein DN53_13655 [Allomuricauda olearia]
MSDKKSIRKKLIMEGAFAFLIAVSPILFYWYKYMPEGAETWSFLGIEFGANGFDDVGEAFYYYFNKIVPLLLLVVWFVTCKNWWYYAILIPISMYSFQLFAVLTFDSNIVDENEVMYVVAVTMVVTPIVYFIRVKLVDKHVHGIDLDAMDAELRILKEKEELRKEREKLEQRQKTLSKKM